MRASERIKRFRRVASYRGVAQQVGVHPQSVKDAVTGATKVPRPELRRAIAEAIGLPEHEVFPLAHAA